MVEANLIPLTAKYFVDLNVTELQQKDKREHFESEEQTDENINKTRGFELTAFRTF